MGTEILHLLAIFCFFLFLIVALKFGRDIKKIIAPTTNIPPGPWKLPIIGNITHIFTPIPHRKLRDLAKIYGPLMHLKLGEVFTIVISSPEYAKEVLNTHDLIFASRPRLLTAGIACYDCTLISFAPLGDYWRQVRKICHVELLSPKRVRSFWPIRGQEITNFIKWIAAKEGSEVNLTQAIFSLVFTITARTTFGKKSRDQDEFMSEVGQFIKLLAGFDIGDLFPSAKWLQNLTGMRSKIEKSHKKVDRILENIINEHREARSRAKEGLVEAKEDLLDVLLKFEGSSSDLDFRLTNNNIKAILLDIYSSGSESSATTDWAVAEMIKNPRVLNKAQAEVREVFDKRGRVDEIGIDELKYLKSVIKETLRLHPPSPLLLPRESRQACEINGYHIPAKSRVLVNAWAIARDPNYWTEPERFYPERFIGNSIDYKGTSFEYLPFGAGRRICPGMNYGLTNIELVLAMLLYHFDWKLPSGTKNEDLDMSEDYGVTVARKDNLYLIPIASRSCLEI